MIAPRIVVALATLAMSTSSPLAAQTVAITGARLHPVSSPPIDVGTIVVTDGKITAVGANVPVPPGARVIDAKGKWVTPGLFNAATALGLVEVGMGGGSTDVEAEGDRGVAAAFRAWEAINPHSALWAPARNEGITTVGVLPSGGIIAGQGAVVETEPGPLADMVRKGPALMVVSFTSAAQGKLKARAELYQRVRTILDDAAVLAKRKTAFENAALRQLAAPAADLEALEPVLTGTLPLLVESNRASDIEAALALARSLRLRIAILGGAEAWMVAPQLAAAKVPVLTTALDGIPTSFDSLGQRQDGAARLHHAGVSVVLITGAGETFNVRNLRQQAGNAVAYGLPWDEALRAVTLAPAEVFGVADSLGTLAPGKDATLVVWDGDPFEFATKAVHVFVRGREVQAPSRQDALTQRYLARRP